jgi:hypothetical protein
MHTDNLVTINFGTLMVLFQEISRKDSSFPLMELSLLFWGLGVVYPLIRQLLSVFAVVAPGWMLRPRTRGRLLQVLDFLGRWALIDELIVTVGAGIAYQTVTSPTSLEVLPQGFWGASLAALLSGAVFLWHLGAMCSLLGNHLALMAHRNAMAADMARQVDRALGREDLDIEDIGVNVLEGNAARGVDVLDVDELRGGGRGGAGSSEKETNAVAVGVAVGRAMVASGSDEAGGGGESQGGSNASVPGTRTVRGSVRHADLLKARRRRMTYFGAGADTVYGKEKVSLQDTLYEIEGRDYKLKLTATGRLVFVVALVVCAFLPLVFCSVNFIGIEAHGLVKYILAMDERPDPTVGDFQLYNFWSILSRLIALSGDERVGPGGGLSYLWLAFWLFALIFVVPVLKALALLVLWIRPMTLNMQKRWFVATEILNAWAAMDVLLFGLIMALSPVLIKFVTQKAQPLPCERRLTPFLGTVVSPWGLLPVEETRCYEVWTYYQDGTFICIFCALMSWFSTHMVMRLAESAVEVRENRHRQHIKGVDFSHTHGCGYELMSVFDRSCIRCLSVRVDKDGRVMKRNELVKMQSIVPSTIDWAGRDVTLDDATRLEEQREGQGSGSRGASLAPVLTAHL